MWPCCVFAIEVSIDKPILRVNRQTDIFDLECKLLGMLRMLDIVDGDDVVKGDSVTPGVTSSDAMTKLIRFSLSHNEVGDIEIYSCVTQTMLVLPKHDVQMLINSLMTLDQMSLPRETVSLDPSS